MGNVRILEVKQSIFESNDKQAALLREELKKDGVFLLNRMSAIWYVQRSSIRVQ